MSGIVKYFAVKLKSYTEYSLQNIGHLSGSELEWTDNIATEILLMSGTTYWELLLWYIKKNAVFLVAQITNQYGLLVKIAIIQLIGPAR